jgi:hypothetical protein
MKYEFTSAPFPRPEQPWSYHPLQKEWWGTAGVLDLGPWLWDFLRGYYGDIRWWWATRHVCPYCNGSGREIVGDYGYAYDVGPCLGGCRGTGKRLKPKI